MLRSKWRHKEAVREPAEDQGLRVHMGGQRRDRSEWPGAVRLPAVCCAHWVLKDTQLRKTVVRSE